VPDEVREQIRRLVEVLGYLPHLQPLGADWADVMPGWEKRVRGWDEGGVEEPRTHSFEEHVVRAGGKEVWAHVVATPVVTEGAEGGEPGVTDAAPALAAWTVFLSDCSPRLPDEVERRRREILELLLESPGDFVVKLDADGRVEFMSPSLCAALGCAAETSTGGRSTMTTASRRRTGLNWPGCGRSSPGRLSAFSAR